MATQHLGLLQTTYAYGTRVALLSLTALIALIAALATPRGDAGCCPRPA
ncbi:hypothetical protein [Salinicola endophyticus]|uniref:Uncharacterized protein n=1 Tax=Salinicola endophyticus TaxID=1949083 RepID=A0AB74UEX1_9GAMM